MFCEKICKYVNIMWLLLTQKHLWWSLFSILSIVKFFRALILKNICKWLFLKMCLQKSFIKRINFTLKKPIFSTSISNFISWLVSQECVFIHIQYFFGRVRNRSSHQSRSVGEAIDLRPSAGLKPGTLFKKRSSSGVFL